MDLFDSHAYLADTALSHAMATGEAAAATLARHRIGAVALVSGLAIACDFVSGNADLNSILNAGAGLFGYATLNQSYPAESQEEQRKYLPRREFVAGLLYSASGTPVNLGASRDILNAQRRYAKPMAVYTPDAEAVHAVREIAAEFSAMKFILLSMGGNDWHYAVAAAKQHVNLYLEISGSLDADKVAYAATVVTARKLLYGSCMPYSDPQLTIGLVEEASTLTTTDRARVYAQNALALFASQRESG
ncbi:MAG: amidohydrolase family protein [Capsulimonadaceae bacterium]